MSERITKYFLNSNASALFVVITLVNAGNYLINLVLGRVLGPAEFAEASILATSVLIISFVAVGFQMTAAKYVASYRAGGDESKAQDFATWFNRQAVIWGCTLSIILLLSNSTLSSFLHFRSPLPLLIIILSIPLYLRMSVQRGIIQGNCHFGKLAFSYLGEMIVRLTSTVAILLVTILLFKGQWIQEGIALGFMLSFIAAFLLSMKRAGRHKSNMSREEKRMILGFMGVISFYELSQIMISYSDIILVKHFFNSHEAGIYAALALMGRLVFFATWSAVIVMLPKVVEKEKQGLPHTDLFMQVMIGVLALGSGMVIGCLLLAGWIVPLLFGPAYAEIIPLLWKYALASTLFASANVFAYYYMSLNNYLPVLFASLAGVVQILSIIFFHQSLLVVVELQILLMGALFISMIFYYGIKTLQNEKVKSSYRISLPTR